MGRNLALNMLQVREAGALYEAGHSLSTVALAFSVSNGAVRSALRVLDIQRTRRTTRVHWSIAEMKLRCVVDVNDCWLWSGCIKPNGYGYVRVAGRQDYAHRLAFRLSGRVLKPGHEVAHECNVRPCCNPEHLVGGTRKQNMKSAALNGRLSVGVLHGMAVRRGMAAAKAGKA